MEIDNNNIRSWVVVLRDAFRREGRAPAVGPEPIDDNDAELLEKLGEYLPVSTMRVETALSRFPIHNLTKGETIPIRITQKGQGGDTDISWSVSPSRDYGEPRQLAYQIDTLVINKRIDQAPRPLPRLIRLGSYREICRELGVQMNGKQKDSIKKALYQNAFAGITAKVSFKAADGRTRRFEKGFTRYSVYFAGDELPNEVTADAVYIYLNEDYWQVLNSAIFRPLDFEYQKSLSAGSHQRFYELVSFAVFAALSKRRDEAKLVYSDYCLRAPQTRYVERAPMQKQMYKIHLPHVRAGYIEKLRYRQITDQDGQADWEIYYTPGPRARAQYAFFRNRQKNEVIEVTRPERNLLLPAVPDEGPDPSLVEELVKRGVSLSRAKKVISAAASKDEFSDLLEWGDHLVASANGKINNPAGFYIYVLEEKVLPPPAFETTRLRNRRLAAQEKADQERARNIRLDIAYEEYQLGTVERYIREELSPEEYVRLADEKRKEIRRVFKTLPEPTVDEIVQQGIRHDLTKGGRVPFLSQQEFAASHNPDQLTLLDM
jgi:hypothetical protein